MVYILIIPFFISCNKDQNNDEPTGVYISSAVASPTSSEQVTIKNNTASTVNIGGWMIGDKNNSTAYTIPSNTSINHGQTKTFNASTMGFQINDSNEIIYLWDSSGNLQDTWSN